MKNMQIAVLALVVLVSVSTFANPGELVCTNGKMTFVNGPQVVDYMTLEHADGVKFEFEGSKGEIIPLVDANPDRLTPAGITGKNAKQEVVAVTFVYGQPSEDVPLGLKVLVVSSHNEQPTELVCQPPKF